MNGVIAGTTRMRHYYRCNAGGRRNDWGYYHKNEDLESILIADAGIFKTDLSEEDLLNNLGALATAGLSGTDIEGDRNPAATFPSAGTFDLPYLDSAPPSPPHQDDSTDSHQDETAEYSVQGHEASSWMLDELEKEILDAAISDDVPNENSKKVNNHSTVVFVAAITKDQEVGNRNCPPDLTETPPRREDYCSSSVSHEASDLNSKPEAGFAGEVTQVVQASTSATKNSRKTKVVDANRISSRTAKKPRTKRSEKALRKWHKRLGELIEYKEKYRNCIVPQKVITNVSVGNDMPIEMLFPHSVFYSVFLCV